MEESCLLVEKPKNSAAKSDLERTIEAMEGTTTTTSDSLSREAAAHTCLCAHPQHLHSFQQVNFLVTLRICAGCQQRIQAVVFGSGADSGRQVVRCLACGVYAHRRCAMNAQLARTLWKEPCPVNRAIIEKIERCRSQVDQKVAGAENRCSNVTLDSPPLSDVDVDGEEELTASAAQIITDQSTDHWTNLPAPSRPVPLSESLLDKEEDVVKVEDAPLHYASHPFASVSRALQENILAHFRKEKENNETTPEEVEPLISAEDVNRSLSATADSETTKPQHNPVVQFVNGTVNAVRTSVSIPGKIGAAAVAGGIAGGVAGLCIAGPAGSIAGYQLGRTAGALGVLLEGSVSVGVLVASVATGSVAGQHIQDQLEERRILEMGERGASRKVLLVRPNIKIDPIWETFCSEAVARAPKQGGLFAPPNATRDHHRRDKDIIQQSEEEIPTSDKIFLLVSRILNDKESLPGHVYRCLIDKFFDRVKTRKELQEEGYADSEASGRICRDDVHAIIKFVTATLLDVRPGLDSSASITELTATAVESLVFGRVYNEIIREIIQETSEKDTALEKKMDECENDPAHLVLRNVSEKALEALRRIPVAHSSVDKLEDCVHFLEFISDHFSSTASPTDSLCADSLLKMVCQHVLVAKVQHLNAEISFLEEFARDEQLLRGREGYSLVTLQAALHFLNMCENVEVDIFGQDNEEENIPLTSTTDLNDSVELV